MSSPPWHKSVRGTISCICSDEIHCELVLDKDKEHIPTATLGPEVERRTITLMAPSKTFNIPGLGCAFAVISDEPLRRQFLRAMSGIVPHVKIFEEAGVGLSDGKPFGAEGFVRLNFGCPRPLLEEALQRMRKIMRT